MATRLGGLRHFNLDEGKTTLLAVGGSLGARSINEALSKGLVDIASEGLQLIWQTGRTTAVEYKEKGKAFPNVWVDEFITKMEMAYAAADVVISRSGAMSVTELCVAKKPVIFVPFPFAAEDHQTVNAQALVQKNSALMVKDSEANESLVSMAISLAKNRALQQQLSINIAKLAVTNADEVIAREVLDAIKT
jgi:UDP-N-acetylglucosamine--N-acetylmuramyl-(pentapeptide) pyrophosphoryl-undecaprenol N-acetylglucosamine transferase